MNEQENNISMNEEANRVEFGPLHQKVLDIKTNLKQAIIGQEDLVQQLLIALFAKGHVLIEGVPGVAKTLAAKSVSRSISAQFSRIQFTPDLMPSDILGTSIFNQKTSDFELKKGPIYANLVLIDEINRAPAKTQAALFEVMEERQVSIDGHTIQLDDPFMVLATQNPVEHEGTYRLPEAQLDRFMFKILVSYPNAEEEMQILNLHNQNKEDSIHLKVKETLSIKELNEFRKLINEVEVDDKILSYISSIIRETRQFPGIFLGASPRAGIALLAASKANAALEDRDFVNPDDVKKLAYPVLRHRILLSPEKEMEGSTPDQLITDVLAKLEVPR